MNALLAHPGTQHSFRLAAELDRRKALCAFYTGLAFLPNGWIDRVTRILPGRIRGPFANRRIAGVAADRIHNRLASELIALWRLRNGDDSQHIWHQRANSFQQSIPDNALAAASAVIAFDTAGWILAQRCAAHDIPFVLDQTTPHPDAKIPLYALAEQQYPEWMDGIEARRPDVRAAEQMEHDLAVRVVAATSFTRRSLIQHGVEPAKICISPYGVDCERFTVQRRSGSQPMRFIFVGQVNARKGIPLLVDAWRRVGGRGAELWVVGGIKGAVRSLLPELPGLRVIGPVPHAGIPRLMQQCDAFVFPSYFEGFGLVLLEALACGLPVITTTATAGPDLVTEGADGWIFEPGDLSRLTEIMACCAENPRMVRELSDNARKTAERFSWSAYGDRWMHILTDVNLTACERVEKRRAEVGEKING